jgi:hypothetical protein
MGKLNNISPSQTKIFSAARPGETPADALDRIQPQRVPLTADILGGTLDVESGVVLGLSGGIGVSGGDIALEEGSEIVLGKDTTS